MDVAILGCGPAGLMAAHAAVLARHRPVIYSRKQKSKMFGAMYLHKPIPSLLTSGGYVLLINVIKSGTKEGYAYNVYGDREHEVSWDSIESPTTAGFDLRATYDELWDRYVGLIEEWELGARQMVSLINSYPLVLSTIPAPALCQTPRMHEFEGQPIWVMHGDGSMNLIPGVNDGNMMYYNGYEHDGSGPTGTYGFDWYRFSQINRYQAWEYSREPHPTDMTDGMKIDTGVKPQQTNCDCWLNYNNYHRLGRFGKWQRGILTHHAFDEAKEILDAL